ncbi:hypothetical protein ACIBG8_33315 [Nonomuraea sp. NPDC050556]|uniref:hypothetical protein n=1 Tax=Nonomuraea sp. NPDC050556 TaxID=3364369 RepID=UPI0037B0A52C
MKGSRVAAAVLAVFLLSGVAACGQPEFTYVRDREGTTYFKVPASFTKIESYPIDLFLSGDHPYSEAAKLARARVWSTAFDQSKEPNPNHMFASMTPFVYATVHKLKDEERDAVSLDQLRDFILPVTKKLREAIETQAAMTGKQLRFTKFEEIVNEPVFLDKGARGVHVRFNYQIGDDVQTFDHTAYLDEQGGTVSVLLISCQSLCYRQRAAEFDKISESFKLLRLPG